MTVLYNLTDSQIKHLELVQGVIGRLASNSFLMKGWALTVSGAFFGFSAKDLDWRIAAVGLMPLMVFWGLDGYFLSRERMFRALYDAVRKGDPNVEPFSMDYIQFKRRGQVSNGWRASLWSRTVAWFYVPVLFVGLALIVVAAIHH
jgi:hypothetical protein